MANYRQISPELAIKARDELHEVESRIPEDITTLRDWIEKQPHLKARTEDQALLTFLRGSKYSLEKAKSKIDHYYTIRSLSPEIFLNRPIDDKARRLLKLGPFFPLPKTVTPDGPRIHITRYEPINPSEFTIIDLLHHQLRIFDIEVYEDDNAVISGLVNIVDMSSMSLGYVLQFDPFFIKKLVVFMDKAIPFRVKGIHMVNAPREAAAILNIFRSLMPKKLKERLFIHPSLENLYEHIPKEYLPAEYGGSNGRFQDIIDHWEKRVLGYKEFFEEDMQYGVNEKLRVGSHITTESLFGVDGSFRKLEVD